MPDGTTTGARSNAHPDATWVESFLSTHPGKTYEVIVNEDPHQAAAREAVEAVGQDFTDDIVHAADIVQADLEGAADDRAAPEADKG